MNNVDFANKAINIAKNYKTLYVLGCFGAPLNASNKKRYTTNLDYNKQSSRKTKINNASSDTFGFDCVCLIKGILWGWKGDKNHTYGGASYCSNGVPDVGSDAIMNYCTNVTTNFSNVQIGEILHMSGHVGIYIGNGLAVECTPKWADGVQITAVGNIGKKTGYNTRTWVNHGKLKYINYTGSNSSHTYYPKYSGNSVSIVDILKSLNIDSSFSNRKSIAKLNGISNYSGTAAQNEKLVELIKKGKLIKK